MSKYLIPLLAAGSLALVAATSPSIGLVKSTGEFRVDGSAVQGNGNVFEGDLVETAAARSVIQLAGVQITLAPDSRARIFRDHTVLEKGSGFFKGGAHHVIEADFLRVAPTSGESAVEVEITNPSGVTVASRGGAAEVRNSSGLLATRLFPGMSLAFSPQEGAASAIQMTGVIEARNGEYFLTDETTKVKVQIESKDASKYVGKRVAIQGSSVPDAKPAGDASQLVRAVTIKTVSAAAGAGGAGGGAAAGAGTAGGLSGVAIGAIVGGVAVVGTLGGLAAAGTFSGSSVSRQ
jgi:hypothetical protein